MQPVLHCTKAKHTVPAIVKSILSFSSPRLVAMYVDVLQIASYWATCGENWKSPRLKGPNLYKLNDFKQHFLFPFINTNQEKLEQYYDLHTIRLQTIFQRREVDVAEVCEWWCILIFAENGDNPLQHAKGKTRWSTIVKISALHCALR